MDAHALAWAAGFFDGEGCTYLRDGHRRRDRPEITLSITQCYDSRVLDRFTMAVAVGGVTGPVNESGTGSGPRWNYRSLRTSDSLLALDRIWPWLGEVKRVQALTVARAYAALIEDRYLRPAVLAEKRAMASNFLLTKGA